MCLSSIRTESLWFAHCCPFVVCLIPGKHACEMNECLSQLCYIEILATEMPQFKKKREKIYILTCCSLLPLFYMVYASAKPKAHTLHIQDSYLILTLNSGCTSVHRIPKLWLIGYEGSLVSNCIMTLKNMDIA